MDDYWLTLGLPGNAGRCDPVWPSNMFVFAIYFGGRAGEEMEQVFRTYYHPVSCQWTILVLRPQFRFRLELVQVKPLDVHFPRAHKLAAWRVARPCWREKMEDAKVVCMLVAILLSKTRHLLQVHAVAGLDLLAQLYREQLLANSSWSTLPKVKWNHLKLQLHE